MDCVLPFSRVFMLAEASNGSPCFPACPTSTYSHQVSETMSLCCAHLSLGVKAKGFARTGKASLLSVPHSLCKLISVSGLTTFPLFWFLTDHIESCHAPVLWVRPLHFNDHSAWKDFHIYMDFVHLTSSKHNKKVTQHKQNKQTHTVG